MDDTAASAVAIVGIGAVMPDAPDAAAFWNNIKSGRYSISDVPAGRWDPELFYDPDPHAPDKTYSKIGGWVNDFGWEPMRWKLPLPPKVGEQMDEGQRWSVACSRAALLDAGWPGWSIDPERVAVIFGNALGGEKHYATTMRVMFPEFARELRNSPSFAALPESVRESVIAETHKAYTSLSPEITEDTMPGELSNMHRRPGRQPVQPPRPELRHRRRLRVHPGGDERGHRWAARPPVRRGAHAAASTATWASTASSSSARSVPCRRPGPGRSTRARTGS